MISWCLQSDQRKKETGRGQRLISGSTLNVKIQWPMRHVTSELLEGGNWDKTFAGCHIPMPPVLKQGPRREPTVGHLGCRRWASHQSLNHEPWGSSRKCTEWGNDLAPRWNTVRTNEKEKHYKVPGTCWVVTIIRALFSLLFISYPVFSIFLY